MSDSINRDTPMPVPQRDREVSIAIVDIRSIPRVCWLSGEMKIPTWATKDGSKWSLRYDQLKYPLKGFVYSGGSDIVALFFIAEPDDAIGTDNKYLSFEQIVDIVKTDDKLKEISREVK